MMKIRFIRLLIIVVAILTSGASFAPKDSKTIIEGNWIMGGYQWPELDGVQFRGSIGITGLRHGW
jgi:hypothetical protein